MRRSPAGVSARHAAIPAAVAALVTGPLVLAAAPAIAHDALIGSEPADGAVVTVAPAEVVLTFAAEQAGIGAEVVVVGSDGRSWSDGAAVTSGATVTQTLKQPMPADAYVVQWRSVAGDGHPVSGTLTFTLDLPAEAGPAETGDPAETGSVEPTAEPEPAASPSVEVSAEALVEEPDGGTGVPWAWIGAGLALVLAAAGAAVVALRRRGVADE